MNKEFREYIRMMISEIMEENSLPTASQLVSPDNGEAPLDKDEDSEVEEMSTVAGSLGNGGGLTAPLGMSVGPRSKKKNPGWT